jgi:hypothetical protein
MSSFLSQKTAHDLALFSREWNDETPRRIHQRTLGQDGRPSWSPGFSSWLSSGPYRPSNPDARLRLTRAMRYLREIAPREHDVMHRVFAGESPEQISDWLNDRAIRGGHPERYSAKDAMVLIASGADKLAVWY